MGGSERDTKPASSQAVTMAVERFWQERARGRAVAVDVLLETSPGTEEHRSLRESVIQTIATQAIQYSKDPSAAAFDDQSTMAQVLRDYGVVPQIEGYDLVACLGRGGMGAVYEGYQQSTGRRVAVKFMLDSIGASSSARKRFEREVEVVARLHHPGIVSIVDSGVRRGRYYYAMDFVQGRPLDEAMQPGHCDVREALELFATVCDAVEYAHQHGILHRDLKPSNIIVDEQAVAHLLDFGLAKVLVDSHGSQADMALTVSGPGQLLGTVAYMSPEQAAGQHDETSVRTDVYSLGAIIYELLTGRLPVSTDGSLHDVLTRIKSVDPAAPSSLRPKLSRDLDAVILKSLEKLPERRYATVGEFAAELRRAVAGEPVLARRVSAAGRGWRWVQRNRAISAVTAFAALTLIVVSTVLIAQVIQERDLARETFGFLRTLLESADPERMETGGTVLQLLDTATSELDAKPPERDLAEAEIREILGIVYRKFGRYEMAQTHQEKVLAIRERRAGDRDDPQVADALHNLAATLWWDGRYAEAEPHYARSLDIRRRLHSGDHPSTAFSMTHLAACRLRMGKPAEARAMYEQVLAMRQRLYGDEHEEVAQALNNLAKCMLEADEFYRAEILHVQALDMIRRLRGDSNLGTAAASQNLGECLLRRSEADRVAGNVQEAIDAAERALEAFQRALNIRRAIYPEQHHFVAASLHGVARAQLLLGNVAEAHELAVKSVQEYRDTHRERHSDFAAALATLGSIFIAQGDGLAATNALAEALAISLAARPLVELHVAQLRSELGLAHAMMNRLTEGEELLLRGLEDVRRLRGDRSLDTALAARRLIRYYTLVGEDERAAAYHDLAGTMVR